MTTLRYSDSELEAFRQLIEAKLERAQEQYRLLQEQIVEITENSDDEYGSDWMDDSSINDNVEMLNDMAIRQRIYVQDLENALVRIRNKTYGICVVTGQLIDKKRLMAVPTTTKSLLAKQGGAQPAPPPAEEEEEEAETPPKKTKVRERPVISRVIRKSAAAAPKASEEEEEYAFAEAGMSEDDDRDPELVSLDAADIDDDYLADDNFSFNEEEEER